MAATDGMMMKMPPNKGGTGGKGVSFTGDGGKDVKGSEMGTTPMGTTQGGDTIAWAGDGGKDVKLNNDAPQHPGTVPKGPVGFVGSGGEDVS